MDPVSPFGVYVHVPFCERRCDYCDFATWTDRAHLVEDYVAACVADARARLTAARPASTVFVGGGTPSLLPAAMLLRILDAIPRRDDAEVTVECNPDSVDGAKLMAYRRAGVTRLSFGVQSMRDHVLAALGRTHDPGNVGRAVAWTREAGFATFNLDLVYGAAGESIGDWCSTLEEVLELDPPHVSAYALTVEPGTPLATRIGTGRTAAPDDDDQAAKFDRADEMLTDAGLSWYEISNWARPGHECRHNLGCWDQHDYVGIGCSAHGHARGRRSWTVRSPERYIERIRAGRSPESGSERLDTHGRAEEHFALALRTRRGVPAPPGADAELDELERAGLLERVGARSPRRVVLTRRGRRLSNEVLHRILAARAPRSACETVTDPDISVIGTR